MEILNKISQLVLMGYTISFKSYPLDLLYIEMTYDNHYHAKYMLTIPCKVEVDYILAVLDILRYRIEKLIHEEKQDD